MCIKSCLCWRDLKSASIAVAVFALTTSLLQILVQVAVYTGDIPHSIDALNADPRRIFIKLYIALAAADFFVVLFSIILLIGIEQKKGCRYAEVPWIIWLFLYILYESAINIYYFIMEMRDKNNLIFTDQLGYLLVPLIYWALKEFILFFGWLCVVSRLCHIASGLESVDDQTLQLIQSRTNTTSSGDSIGPIYYNGAATQVHVRDNPRASCSHFDVVRPTNSCQVYSPNWGRATPTPPTAFYGGNGGVYGPSVYYRQN